MARQIGSILVEGTIHGICFYKMDDSFYARAKSSLDGKRVKTDKAFTKTMINANRLGSASRLSSKAYRVLRPLQKNVSFCRSLTSMAMRLLKEGKSEAAVETHLNDQVTLYLKTI